MGVAVQSHHFSVGAMVAWARAGVGAVATQSMVEMSYGPLGLELMSFKIPADQALKGLLAADRAAQWRQVAMIDARGNVSVHTGSKCTPFAGSASGEQFSCQGNLLVRRDIVEEMRTTFSKSVGLTLAERLVKSLLSGEEAGGDLRGKQSAAILVVGGEYSTNPYSGRLIDLRVEDHPDPIVELERLLHQKRAVDRSHKGMAAATSGDYEVASKEYKKANEIYPLAEFRFWRAVYLSNAGKQSEANKIFKSVFEEDKRWVLVAQRLHKVGRLAKLPP